MRNSYLFIFFSVISTSAFSQMLTPTVISTTGAYASNANGSLSYTVGEMAMVETFSANGNILTQGFQQPNQKMVTSLIDVTQDAFGSLVVYPNPAVDDLWFGLEMPEAGKVTVSVYNVIGQKVSDVYEANYTDGKVIQPINVSLFAGGVYLLTMTFTSDRDGKVRTTTKKFQVIR